MGHVRWPQRPCIINLKEQKQGWALVISMLFLEMLQLHNEDNLTDLRPSKSKMHMLHKLANIWARVACPYIDCLGAYCFRCIYLCICQNVFPQALTPGPAWAELWFTLKDIFPTECIPNMFISTAVCGFFSTKTFVLLSYLYLLKKKTR